MNAGDIPGPDTPGLMGGLEDQARALAVEHGLDPGRVLGVVRRGRELIERHGEGIDQPVLSLLRGAMRSLPAVRVLEIFEREDLVRLAMRHGYPPHLADGDTPLYTLSEFAELLAQFRAFLRQQQAPILARGEPQEGFTASRWLDRRLSPLYYTRLRTAQTSASKPALDHPEFDIWKVREAIGKRAHDPQTGQLDLDPVDATRLAVVRPKMLELKSSVLARIGDALRYQSEDRLWSDCLDLMCGELTTEDLWLYLRLDRLYRGEDARRDGSWDEPSPIRSATLPGGLSDILEVIGHCECELRFGVMHQTKEELLALAKEFGQSDWRGVLGRTYFDLLDQPWRAQLDEIIDRYVQRQVVLACSGYWGEFRDRLTSAIANRWLWAPADWPAMRREIERVFARVARSAGSNATALPQPSEGSSEEESDADGIPATVVENVFEKQGDVWRIRFAGMEKPCLHRKGMHYIAYLLEHPYQKIDVLALRHAIEPAEAPGHGGTSGSRNWQEAAAQEVARDAFNQGKKKAMQGPAKKDEMVRGLTDQARDAVKADVSRAKKLIRTAHPQFYAHLKAFLTIGHPCSYDPPKQVVWNRPTLKTGSRVRPK